MLALSFPVIDMLTELSHAHTATVQSTYTIETLPFAGGFSAFCYQERPDHVMVATASTFNILPGEVVRETSQTLRKDASVCL